jgi:hypothetical protein
LGLLSDIFGGRRWVGEELGVGGLVRDALWGGRRDAFLIGGGGAFRGRDWYRRRGKTF